MKSDGPDPLELSGISKAYGDEIAVRPLDLTVRQGEFFSLLGPSGCGKTTTLRMMAGFETPDTGRILIEGVDMTAVPANRRPVNLVFQRYELFPHMTVAKNVGYGLRVKRTPRSETAKRVGEMLDVVGIGALAERKASQLSGGQQQRVALARALVNRPRVLLLDEPLSALDVKLREKMQLELKSIQEHLGTTFVFVTHDQDEAMAMSDRIGVMDSGNLVQVGTPEQIYQRPADAFVANFVGKMNEISVTASDDGEFRSEGAVLELNGARRGEVVSVRVRPELIGLRPITEPADAPNWVHGIVTRIVFLGTHHRVHVDTALGEVEVTAPANVGAGQPFGAGDRARLTWHSTTELAT